MKLLQTGFFGVLFFFASTTVAFGQIPSDSLQLHLKADAGVTTDINGKVTTWADQSGQMLSDTEQSLEARRPELVADAINGNSAIRFSGGAYLNLPAASEIGITNSDYEIYIIYRSNSVKTELSNIEFLLSGGSEQFELHTNGGGGLRYIPNNIGIADNTGRYIDVGTTGAYTNTEVQIIRLQATDTYGSITVNGSDNTLRSKNSQSSFTGNILLGLRAGDVYGLDGEIGEMIMYNQILSETQSDSVMQYLQTKYFGPTQQVQDIEFTGVYRDSLKLNITPGDGSKRLVIAKSGSAVNIEPENGTTYTAGAEFGTSMELGTGNYVVYNGAADSVVVTGLNPNTDYHFYAVEYNGEAGEELYLTANPLRQDTTTALIPKSDLRVHLSADKGVTTVSGKVSVWADQSGNNNDAGQTSASFRPTFVANSMNDEPGLRFNGSGNLLALPKASDIGITNNDYQIFIVAKTSSATNNVYFLTSTQTAAEQFEIHTNGTKGVRFLPNGSPYIDEGTTGAYTDGYPHIFQIEATSTYGLIRMDGNSSAQSSGDRRSNEESELLLGTRSGGQYWFDGDISEVIIYNAVLNESDRQIVEEYLKVKYNIDQPADPPTVQASNLSVSEVTSNSMKISLTPGDGEKRLILASMQNSFTDPADSVSYASSSVFGSGNQIGSGNYVVYDGTGSEVTVTGLDADINYYFTAYEYNGRNSNVDYLQGSAETVSQRTNNAPPEILSTSFQESLEAVVFEAKVNTYEFTEYKVYWGTNPSSYADSASFFVGDTAKTIKQEITGLTPNTAYFAEIKAITAHVTVSSEPMLYFKNNSILSDSLSLWLAADQGVASLQESDKVSVWYDLSGNENNATQSNASFQPQFYSNQINGLPAFNFSEDYFSLPSNQELGLVDEDYEIIIVAKSDNTLDAMIFGNSYTIEYASNVWFTQNGEVRFSGNTGNGSDFNVGEEDDYTDNIYHVINATGTNNEGRIRLDYILSGIDDTEGYWNSSDGNPKIGGTVSPYNGTLSSPFNGHLAEIIVYNKKLTPEERFDVHEYLSDKYNLALPLNTPAQQVSNVALEKSGPTSVNLNFTPGDGSQNLVVMKSGSTVDALPSDSTEYTASAEFGEGSELGSGNYVVSTETDTTVTITGLTPGETYHVAVFSYNGDSGLQKYLVTNPDTSSILLPLIISVDSFDPAPFSLQSETDAAIEVSFTYAMDPSSFSADSSFIVNGSVSGAHSGTFTFSNSDKTVSFTPSEPFLNGEEVEVTLSSRLSGSIYSFDVPQSYSFRVKTERSSAKFSKASEVSSPGAESELVTGDFNNDGWSDFVMLVNTDVYLYTNNTDSTFSSSVVGTVSISSEILPVDADNDGDLDLATINSSKLYILWNDGSGSFHKKEAYSTDNIYAFDAGDLDNDGSIDFAIYDDLHISVVSNQGDSTYASVVDFASDNDEENSLLQIADINGDGNNDIIVYDYFNQSYSSFINNGNTTFSDKQFITNGNNVAIFSIADVDGDGDGDLISGSQSAVDKSLFEGVGNLYIAKNNGDGTFSSAQQYGTGYGIQTLEVQDLDGDRDLDIATTNSGATEIVIRHNDGNGGFESQDVFSIESSDITKFISSDFDRNGTVDLILANDGVLELYLNSSIDPLTLTGPEGWRFMASPMGTTTYSSLLSTLWTQGFTGATTMDGTPNVYIWPNTSSTNSETEWTAISNISDSLKMGQGMLVYVYSDDNGPNVAGDAGFPKEINFYGQAPSGTQILNDLINQNSDGWTLLGNPFYQTVDWDNFERSGLYEAVYVYDAAASGWKSWNGTSGSLTDGAIEPYKAFFVQSTGSNGVLEISDPDNSPSGELPSPGKAKDNPGSFYFSLKDSSTSGFTNEAWFQFSEEASTGIDKLDAHVLRPFSPKYTLLGSRIDEDILLDINNKPLKSGEISIPLYFESTESGQHEISLNRDKIPGDWEIVLQDHKTGKAVALDKPYIFSHQPAKNKKADVTPGSLLNPMLKAKAEDSNRFSLIIKPGAEGGNGNLGIPQEFGLKQNYPNPFNPSTIIKYQLPVDSKVELRVYDLLGREVATLVDDDMQAGYHEVTFSAGNLASGLYLYRLKAGNTVITRKLTLIK